ncbi:tyrosine-protein kinase Fer-like isoform X2 [Dreissena polymorpha]|nr:tyrosine-protein kinase Fer-like isoform X2 [Dreissena polymorpha]
MGSDEAVEDTHSLSNVSSSKLTAPPPLPPKPVIKHVKTLQKNEVKMCELNNDDILLDTHICKIQGTCFEVYKGVLKESNRAIAVKACFETISEEQGKTLATEGKLLMQYDHKNIVKLIGIAAQRKPVMLVMEQFSDGILRDYLMENGKNMTNIQKANICLDVANGMVYLSNNRCLHMDLRAASCMVGDNQVVKIFNFAKSIEADEWDICGTYKFPIKWTSPETLQDGKYNTNSEVWSYGIIMWEVFSNGTIPYPGWTNPLALDKVKQGYRMPAPENTPNSIYQLMLRCWDAKPLTRITFQEICSALTHLMDNPQKEDHWS